MNVELSDSLLREEMPQTQVNSDIPSMDTLTFDNTVPRRMHHTFVPLHSEGKACAPESRISYCSTDYESGYSTVTPSMDSLLTVNEDSDLNLYDLTCPDTEQLQRKITSTPDLSNITSKLRVITL